MFKILVEKTKGSIFEISPMSVKREWMDKTSDNHAYRCFPLTQANVIGWNISCTQDIIFTWNGINDQTDQHVKIVSPTGSYAGRGQSSVSFNTGLVFKTDDQVSLWTLNPVNYFNDDFETISNLISTSFYDNPLPLAIKAKKANSETIIRAGIPIATIIPISLTNLNHTCIDIIDYSDPQNLRQQSNINYGKAAQELISSGQWTNWYRDAVNEKNESIGTHEVKTLKLYVANITKDGRIK